MSKELAKTYDPKGIEERLYSKWLDKGYFHADITVLVHDGKEVNALCEELLKIEAILQAVRV